MRKGLSGLKRREMYVAGGICLLLLVFVTYFYLGQTGKNRRSIWRRGIRWFPCTP